MSHDDDRRRDARVADLDIGDMVFTPAQRWETVTHIADDEASVTHRRVFTDHTGESYSWHWWTLTTIRRVPAWEIEANPAVRVQDWTYLRRGHLTAAVSAYQRSGYDAGNTLVTAEYNGPGQGWSVIDHPAGGPAVVTTTDTKAKAVTVLNRAARTHAKALGLPFIGLPKTGGA